MQNWIQYEGNVFRFPGGGTQFPRGADAYIDELASVIPLDNGMVRTALDTGCGVRQIISNHPCFDCIYFVGLYIMFA